MLPALRAGLSWGRGFETPVGPGWVATDASVTGYGSFATAGEEGLALKLDTTLGVRPGNDSMATLQLFWSRSGADQAAVRLVPSYARRIRGETFGQVGVVFGTGAAPELGVKFGIFDGVLRSEPRGIAPARGSPGRDRAASAPDIDARRRRLPRAASLRPRLARGAPRTQGRRVRVSPCASMHDRTPERAAAERRHGRARLRAGCLDGPRSPVDALTRRPRTRTAPRRTGPGAPKRPVWRSPPHQPRVPGPPLTMPSRSLVTQPP